LDCGTGLYDTAISKPATPPNKEPPDGVITLRIKLAGLISCLWAVGEASNPVIAKKATRLEKVTIAIVISKDER
jgi:hypothetical protein